MPNKVEVEVRAVLSPGRAKQILERAQAMGAKLKWQGELRDEWLCRKEALTAEEISIDKSGFALRLRSVADPYSNRELFSLECKTLADGRDHALCNEIEMPIASKEDAAKARQLLTAIGFKVFLEVNKKRALYKLGEVLFVFEDIRGFGNALEIEVMELPQKAAARKKQLLELAAKLGLKKEELQSKSATYLLMRKKLKC